MKWNKVMTNRLTFTEFVNKLKQIENTSDIAIMNDWCLEQFFDKIIKEGISLESVVTGDIAQVTKPIMMLRRKNVYESAPKSKEAEAWILANKAGFKKRYGKDWQQVLYATAHKLFTK